MLKMKVVMLRTTLPTRMMRQAATARVRRARVM